MNEVRAWWHRANLPSQCAFQHGDQLQPLGRRTVRIVPEQHQRRGLPDFSFYYSDKAMYEWLDAGLRGGRAGAGGGAVTAPRAAIFAVGLCSGAADRAGAFGGDAGSVAGGVASGTAGSGIEGSTASAGSRGRGARVVGGVAAGRPLTDFSGGGKGTFTTCDIC